MRSLRKNAACALALVLMSCDENSEVKPPTISPADPPAVPAPEPPDPDFNKRSNIPQLSEIGEGDLSADGMIDVFGALTGETASSDVKPLSGHFRVWNEGDFGGQNRMFFHANFASDPLRSKALADEILANWRAKFSANPDYRITVKTSKEPEGEISGMKFTAGTQILSAYDPFALFRESSNVFIDPNTGNIHIWCYRGASDEPEEREN